MTAENNVPEHVITKATIKLTYWLAENNREEINILREYAYQLLKERDEARLEAKAYREVAIRSGCTMCNGGNWNENRPTIVDAEKQRIIDEWKKEEGKGE